MTNPLFETSEGRRTYFFFDVFGQMFKGSVLAATAFFGPVIFIYALAVAGSYLPAESKEAVDPTPYSFVSKVAVPLSTE